MKILPNLIKDAKDESIVRTSERLNNINPIIDRIMEDDSVESVILINDQGSPLLTNVPVVNATNIGRIIHPLRYIVRAAVQNLDVLDEALVIRMNTKKYEIMMVPHQDFSVIVFQHARVIRKVQTKRMLEARYAH